MSGPVTIRSATTDDTDTLFDLLCGIVQDHLPGQRPWTTPEQLRQDGFGVDPLFEALIAEHEAEPVGFITFYRGYASWRSKPMAMIGNFYTVEHARGLGVGRLLLASLARIAKDRGWLKLEIFVEEGRRAIGFYHAVGLRDLGHRHCRLEGEAFDILARAGLPARS
jgi:GNAT superfamily N-acetyltransferase